MSGFMTGIVSIVDHTGDRVDTPNADGDHSPVELQLGPTLTSSSTKSGSLTRVTIDAAGGGGGTVVALDTHDDFRALAPGDVVDGEQFIFAHGADGGPDGPYVYSTTDGAGQADDDRTILKLTAIGTGGAGAAYNANSSPVLPTIAALRLAVSGKQGVVHVQNYARQGDNGGGIFRWDPTGTGADDFGVTIVPTGVSTGRWIRQYTGDVEVTWFGGLPDAKYFNSSNGRWYKDSGHTQLCTDDAPKLRHAYAFAASIGIVLLHANVHAAAADWNIQSRETGASDNQIVTPISGVSFYGDGDGTCFHFDAGMTTTVNGGYCALFGTLANVAFNNIRFRDFRVDFNSQHNQFEHAGYGNGGNTAFRPQCGAVIIPKGDAIRCENITLQNRAGVFGIVTGFYGYVDQCSNMSIDKCHSLHEGDDPNVGDTSVFVSAGVNAHVTDCIVDNDTANSVHWPNGNMIITGFEIHSDMGSCVNCVVNDLSRGLNLAGDSLSQDQFIVSGCNFGGTLGCIEGIALYPFAGHSMTGLNIGHNNIKIRQNTINANGEAGIIVADPAAAMLAPGNGILHSRFHHNQIIFSHGTPTTGVSFGMDMLGIADDVEIDHNAIVGFDEVGILWNALDRTVNTGNLLRDLRIRNNFIHNCGLFGIFLGGHIGEASPVLVRGVVTGNVIVDDRGGGSHLSVAVQTSVKMDAFFICHDNPSIGYVTAAVDYNTAQFPGSGTLPLLVDCDLKVTGNADVVGNLRVGGTSAAQQALHVTGLGLFSSNAMQRADNVGAAFGWGDFWQTLADTGAYKNSSGSLTYWSWDGTNWNHNIPNFNLAENIQAQWVQATRIGTTNDTHPWIFKSQGADAAATGTHRNGGYFQFRAADATNGGTVHGYFEVTDEAGTTSFLKTGKDTSGNPKTTIGGLSNGLVRGTSGVLAGAATVVNADVDAGAAIASTKLDFSAVAQDFVSTGRVSASYTGANYAGYFSGSSNLYSQITADKAGVGAITIGIAAADNCFLTFGMVYSNGHFVARDDTFAAWYKGTDDHLTLYGSTGNTVGMDVALTARANWDLSDGFLRLGGSTTATEMLEVEGRLSLKEQAAPSTPTGFGKVYVADGSGGTTAGQLRYKGPSGTDTLLAAP